MHTLMSMGHGDEIVLADADFPAASHSQRLIRADGLDVATLLEAILPFFPLDSFVDNSVVTMDCSPWGDEPESYERFRKIIRSFDPGFKDFGLIERFKLYERASQAYAVVVTSEADGNVILKKGPVMSEQEISIKRIAAVQDNLALLKRKGFSKLKTSM
jgi:L-fucose mutarotase